MKILLFFLLCEVSFGARPEANFHLGASGGISTLSVPQAQVEFEVRFFHHFTFGIGGSASITTNSLKLSSSISGLMTDESKQFNSSEGFLTLNFYSRPYLSGIWLRLGMGWETFRSGNSFMNGNNILFQRPFFAGLGWRWMSYETLSFSLGFQAKFYDNIRSSLFSNTTSVILSAFFQIGFSFEELPH